MQIFSTADFYKKTFLITLLSGILFGNSVSAQGFCQPTYGSACSSDDYINNFLFNTLSSLNSGCNGNANNYIHDLSTTTSVFQGGSYVMKMQAGLQYNEGFGVWIDYNGDGDFAEADEFVYASPNASTDTFTAYISIPATAAVGVSRLRVRCNYAGTVTAADTCTNFSYGETEDYDITIAQPVACSGPVAGSAIATETFLCDTTIPFFLTLNGSPDGTTQTYQWEDSPNGTTWTPIAGATTKSISKKIQQSTHFRCMVTCSASSLPSTSVFVGVNPVLSLTLTPTDVTCYGLHNGSITALVTGGTSPFTYVWSQQEQESRINPRGSSLRSAAVNNSIPNAKLEVMQPTGFPNAATLNNLYSDSYQVVITDSKGCTISGAQGVDQPSPLTLQGNSSSPSTCGSSTGAASVTPSGGTVPYTYSWQIGGQTNDTLLGAAAALYGVTVTDSNGCTAFIKVPVSDATAALLTFTTSNVSCNGLSNGSASVTPNGGTAPFTYAWFTPAQQTTASITGLNAGQYFVIVVDQGGCKSIKDTTIYQPDSLKSGGYAYGASCGVCNGSVNVNPIGGTYPYTYVWFDASTNSGVGSLCAGDYTVTVTDQNGCSLIDTITVTKPAALHANATQKNVSCFGAGDGLISVIPTGGVAPYYFTWTPANLLGDTASALVPGTYTVIVTDSEGCSGSGAQADTAVINITQPVLLTCATAITNSVSCNGGSNGVITATPNGGTAPYTYSWSPGGQATQTASNLAAGTYTLMVKDAHNCITYSVKTLNQPATSVTSTVTAASNVSCFGGSNGTATAAASGGTGAYAYMWMPGGQTTQTASGLAANTYTLTVKDANNCSAAATKTITEPAVLTASVSSANPTCNGLCNGNATAIPAGGTGPYSFAWSNGKTTVSSSGLCASTYSVSLTDAKGCIASQTVTLGQPTAVNASATVTNATCNNSCDGSLIASASGGTGAYSYTWLPGGNTTGTIGGLCAGTYTLVAKDVNGCIGNHVAAVGEPTALTTTLTQTNATCNGACTGSASVNVSGGTGPYTYLWVPSGNTNPVASLLCPGRQSVIITDNNNCVKIDTITVGQPLPVPITVTATPTSCGTLSGTAAASVSGAGAIPPFAFLWSTGSTTGTISGLDAGTYNVNVIDGKGCFGFAEGFVTSSNGPVVTTATSTGITDVSCAGLSDGAINISVTGGTTPYTFLWSNGKTTEDVAGLSFGPYEVNVTDASGCVVVKSIFVNEPAALVLSSSAISSGCAAANGSASVMAAGGTSPYSYLWNAGGQSTSARSNIGAGIYVVHVTDSKGCADSALIAVKDSGGPVVFVDTVVAANCGSNGYIILVPQDSNAISGYNWTTGSTQQNLTGVTPGNYGVVVTDTSGCKSVLIAPVNPVLPPIKPICLVTVDTLTQQNIIVWEKPISSFISGFNIYRESSKQGIYQKIAFSPYSHVSTYYDSIPDASVKWARYRISMTDVCGVEGPLSPDHKTIHLSNQFMNNDSTSLIWDPYVGYAFAYYHILRKDSANGAWVLLDSVPASQTSYLDKHVPHTGDTIFYHVDVAHSGGDCVASIKYPEINATSVKSSKSNSSDRMTINPDVSVPQIIDPSSISIFPNPSSGAFSLESSKQPITSISILNILGENVYQKNINAKKADINIPAAAKGVYQIQIITGNSVINKKVIIK